VQSIRGCKIGSCIAALFLVFVEGMRHPTLPQPALLGLRSAKPVRFLKSALPKKCFATANIQNCLCAYKILQERHCITPSLHTQPEVNLAILNLQPRSGPLNPANTSSQLPLQAVRGTKSPHKTVRSVGERFKKLNKGKTLKRKRLAGYAFEDPRGHGLRPGVQVST
jgi:hypothetical protein